MSLGRSVARWSAALVAASILHAAPAAAANCDRVCLGKVLDGYLAAVVAHDPAAAPLAPRHHATENAAAVAPGAGIWQTADSLGPIQRRLFDIKSGQALYFGQLIEKGATDIVAVRVKISGKRVSEAEWTIARKGAEGMFDADALTRYPPPDGVIPAAERTPRPAMIAAANSYFDGLGSHDGSMVPKIKGCERIENGVKVTHRPRNRPPGTPDPAPVAGAPNLSQEELSGDCADGFEMFAKTIAAAEQRRYLIDEEAGAIVGATIFRRPPGVTMRRNLLTELFYMRGGKISGIWAAMYYLDPAAPFSSGW